MWLLILIVVVVIAAGVSALVSWGVAKAASKGNRGATGWTGTTGYNGSDGLDGPAGHQGATGPAGQDGIIGHDGATGATGLNGANGAAGPQGSVGPTGQRGSTGVAGASANTGAVGPTGSIVVTGWITQTFSEQYLLISDPYVPTVTGDTGFVNPMAIVSDDEATLLSSTDVFWIAANGVTDTLEQVQVSSLKQFSYTFSGTDTGAVVELQTVYGTGPAAFTNLVVFPSTSTGFVFEGPSGTTGPARIVASDLGGRLFAYNSSVSPTLEVVVDNSSVSSYMGLANVGNLIYAVDFKVGNIEMYDTSFTLVGTFTDPNANFVFNQRFHPFSIYTQSGLLFVPFVQNDGGIQPINHDGNGVTNIFLPNGAFFSRFQGASYSNSPFGFATVPPFKTPSGNAELWVCNYGNGFIQRFDFSTGTAYPLVQSVNRDVMENAYGWSVYFPLIGNLMPGSPLQILVTSGLSGGNSGALRLLLTAPPDNVK